MSLHKVPEEYSLAYKDLPNPKRVWVGKPGSREEGLGRLSLLTPEVVLAANKSEVQTGVRVGMNWDLTKLEYAGWGRKACQHEIVVIPGDKYVDDVYHFNPQQGSQWDGFRHHGQPVTQGEPHSRKNWTFFGGTSFDEILDRNSTRIGTQFWATEGIAGRAVLLDYAAYAKLRGITYSTFTAHSITLKALKEIAAECNVKFQKGDILLIRSGHIAQWEAKTDTEKREYAENKNIEHAGLEQTPEMLEWLWDSGFAAVAGDAVAFEAFPSKTDFYLHEYLLAGWGCPIGEMFDLEGLAKSCEEMKRWTFFLTSMPLNMPGGVSSPPNAMALF